MNYVGNVGPVDVMQILTNASADLLTTKHDVSGSLEAVNNGLSTGVEVVILSLDNAVVHIHCGDRQLKNKLIG